MSHIAYVNGRYLPHNDAYIHIEDRGYQFADGVYEVFGVLGGRLIDEDRHFQRLTRSLSHLRMAAPMGEASIRFVLSRIIRRNLIRDGFVYLQITRGVARRDHAFPKHAKPSLVVTARHKAWPDLATPGRGVGVITTPDIRWKRVDIKSLSLLPNVLAKQAAVDAGAFDSWMVDEAGLITEGSASNAWIVNAEGCLLTRKAGSDILNGCTRLGVIDALAELDIPFSERPFSVEEVKQAREAFLTSSTNWLLAVTSVDGQPIGDGEPGPVTRRLLAHYAKTVDV